MPGTVPVLIIALTVQPLFFVAGLVIASRLAKRSGQKVRKLSWSLIHGFTAEFYSEREQPN